MPNSKTLLRKKLQDQVQEEIRRINDDHNRIVNEVSNKAFINPNSKELPPEIRADFLANPNNSDWLEAIFSGDYEELLAMLHRLTESEVNFLLHSRKSFTNLSLLIFGTFMNFSGPEWQNRKQGMKGGHMKILIKLLSLGVDVNERSTEGKTALHYCGQTPGHVTDLNSYQKFINKIAERLIRAGADVNAQNSHGETPLHQCAIGTNFDLVRLLLANGADPYIKTIYGHTSVQNCAPFMIDVFGEYEKKKAMEARKRSRDEAGGSFRQCGRCGGGVGEKVMKRCTGCYLFWYCGKQCQLEDWPQHQQGCKKTKMEYKTVFLTDNVETGKYFLTGQVFSRLSGDRPKKSHFIVRVYMTDDDDVKVYNEDCSICGRIIEKYSPTEVNVLKEKIKKEELKDGYGLFFYATIPKNEEKKKDRVNVVEIKINIQKVQPIEGW